MSRRWSLRPLAIIAASALLCSSGCSDADVPVVDPDGVTDPALADVVFEGGATPAALEQLLADDPVFDQTWYPTFSTPADGETMAAATPYRFSWEAASVTGAPVPLDGVAYYLRITNPADEPVLRVFTTGTSYTPDSAAWSTLLDEHTDLVGWLLMGRFVDGKLVSTRSQSSWLVFRIEAATAD